MRLVAGWVAVALLSFAGAVPSIAQDDETCLMCHGERSLTMTRRGQVIPLFVDAPKFAQSAHGSLGCATCHEGFDPAEIPHARRIKPVDCLSCHDGEKLEHYSASVHAVVKKGGKSAASCTDCHTTHAITRLSDLEASERKVFDEQTCARCHSGIHEKYMKSDHGRALVENVPGAPACIDCHGEHGVQSPRTEGAPTSRLLEAKMCLSCHLDDPEVRSRVGPSTAFISSYENSVHGQAIRDGNDAAATCSDCHGSHEMMKGSNPASNISKKHIAETCGNCHGDILEQYKYSIHATALARGISASATCTDCHGEHDILSPQDARSRVSAKNVSAQVCSPCHASVRLTEKYGLAGNRFQSFADSYHGLANKAGSVEVANCASCHGVHDIKPSSDPTSRIHKDNLVKTCGTCHPGANENFTKGSVHVIARAGDDEVLYFVATTYVILIVVVIGGMLIHNLLDFIRKSKRQLMLRRGIIQRDHLPHRLYLRMSLGERVQHGTLLVSFTILVITGFMLRFPDAWWVVPVREVSPAVFEIRSLLHRIAGVVMVAASLYHIYYVLVVPRGKQLIRDLLPVRQDITDLIRVMKYNLGLSQDKPKFGRFSYIEKSEYWALVWGTVIMALTGLILWFDNTFIGMLTKLGWDVARTVHYYEAWLATLAIIVWHFYFVIFNPDVYPVNLAFWKGTLTAEEMHDEHPLELEEIHRRELAEKAAEKADVKKEVEEESVP